MSRNCLSESASDFCDVIGRSDDAPTGLQELRESVGIGQNYRRYGRNGKPNVCHKAEQEQDGRDQQARTSEDFRILASIERGRRLGSVGEHEPHFVAGRRLLYQPRTIESIAARGGFTRAR